MDGRLSTASLLWFDTTYHMRPGLSGVIISRRITVISVSVTGLVVAFDVSICVSISVSILSIIKPILIILI